MSKPKNCCGDGNILYIAAAVSNIIACHVDDDDLDFLSNFFSVLGDSLALIDSSKARCNNGKNSEENNER